MSYTTIQVKRTNNKTLDDSSLANIVPAYGEIVFSHTSGKDEFVIGDNSTTIPNLPRLNMQAISNLNGFDGNKLTLGDNTHQGSIELYDGSNNKTTVQPSSTSSDIIVILPSTGGTLVTSTSINYALSDEPGGNATYVKPYGTGVISTNKDFNILVDTRQYDNGIAVGEVDNAKSGFPTGLLRTNVKKDGNDTIVNVMIGKSTTDDGIGQITLGRKYYKTTIVPNDALDTLLSDATITLPATSGTLAIVGGNLGDATANTPTAGDSSTKVATTAFVDTAISNNKGVVSFIQPTEPTGTTTGQLWVNTSNDTLNYFSGSTWKPIVGVWG